jgi:hypothetical protein
MNHVGNPTGLERLTNKTQTGRKTGISFNAVSEVTVNFHAITDVGSPSTSIEIAIRA